MDKLGELIKYSIRFSSYFVSKKPKTDLLRLYKKELE